MSRNLPLTLKRPGPAIDPDAEGPPKRSKTRSEHGSPVSPDDSTGQASVAPRRESYASIYGRREPPKPNGTDHAQPASNAATDPRKAPLGRGDRVVPEPHTVARGASNDGRSKVTFNTASPAKHDSAKGTGPDDTGPTMLNPPNSKGSAPSLRNTEANGSAPTSPAERRTHEVMSTILDFVRWDARSASAEAAIRRAEQRLDMVKEGSKNGDERAAAQADLRSEQSRRDLAASKIALAESHLSRIIHASVPGDRTCVCDDSKLDETNARVQHLSDQVDALKKEIEKLSRGNEALAAMEAVNRTAISDLRSSLNDDEHTNMPGPEGPDFPTYYNERVGNLGLRSSQHRKQGEKLSEAYAVVERQRRQFESNHNLAAEDTARSDHRLLPRADARFNEERRDSLRLPTALESEGPDPKESKEVIATKVIQDGHSAISSIKRALYGEDDALANGLPLVVRIQQLEEAHQSQTKISKERSEVLDTLTIKSAEHQKVTEHLRILVGEEAGSTPKKPLVTRIQQLENSCETQDKRLIAVETKTEIYGNAIHEANKTSTAIVHEVTASPKATENQIDIDMAEVTNLTTGHTKAIEDLRHDVKKLQEHPTASQHTAVGPTHRATRAEQDMPGPFTADPPPPQYTSGQISFAAPHRVSQSLPPHSRPSTTPPTSGHSSSPRAGPMTARLSLPYSVPPHQAGAASQQAGYASSASAFAQNMKAHRHSQHHHQAPVANAQMGESSAPPGHPRLVQADGEARVQAQPALQMSQSTHPNMMQNYPSYIPNNQTTPTDWGRMVASLTLTQQQMRNVVGAVQSLEQRHQNMRVDGIVQQVLNQVAQYIPQGQEYLDLVHQIPALRAMFAQLDHRVQVQSTSLINNSNSVNRIEAELTSTQMMVKGADTSLKFLAPKVEELHVWKTGIMDRVRMIAATRKDLEAWRADTADRIDKITTAQRYFDAWKTDISNRVEMIDAAHADQVSSVIAHSNDISEIKGVIFDPPERQTPEADPASTDEDPEALKTARRRPAKWTRTPSASDTASLVELRARISGLEALIESSKAAMAELRQRLENVETLEGKLDNEIKNITFLKENMEQVREETGLPPVDFASRSWTPPAITTGASRIR